MREILLTRHAAAASSCRCGRARGGRVGIYACGPTVYGRIHIGNARPFVVFSLLRRFLVHEGYDVTLVINITDVNDKIYDAAQAAGCAERRARSRDDRAPTAPTPTRSASAAPIASRSPRETMRARSSSTSRR